MADAIHVGEMIGTEIRRLREQRMLSVRAVAAIAGFSPSFISQLENNAASPSISSLQRIASALGVTLSQMFETAPVGSLVVRASDRGDMRSSWSKASLQSLNPGMRSRFDPVLITMAQGGSSAREPYPSSAEEFVFVLLGSVELSLGTEQLLLRKGDAVTVPAGLPYRFENISHAPAELLVVRAG